MYFRIIKTCLEIFELNPARFLTAQGLAMQASLKNPKIIDLLTDIDVLLMVENISGVKFVTILIDMFKLSTNT